MTVYKYDTHVHTKEVSRCGKVSAEETVEMYKNAGYEGIVITDHYYDYYFYELGDLSWERKIDCYLRGYKNALEAGRNLGLKVILGMEIRFQENENDYLVYGINEDFLKKNRELYRLGLKDFRSLADKEKILIFQAHPFRPFMIPAPPELIDGVEVFNGNPRHNSNNDKAYEYALENRLLMLSGSDFHQPCDIAAGGIIISESISDARQLTDILRNDKITGLIKNT